MTRSNIGAPAARAPATTVVLGPDGAGVAHRIEAIQILHQQNREVVALSEPTVDVDGAGGVVLIFSILSTSLNNTLPKTGIIAIVRRLMV
jgi:hypothetical protein